MHIQTDRGEVVMYVLILQTIHRKILPSVQASHLPVLSCQNQHPWLTPHLSLQKKKVASSHCYYSQSHGSSECVLIETI